MLCAERRYESLPAALGALCKVFVVGETVVVYHMHSSVSWRVWASNQDGGDPWRPWWIDGLEIRPRLPQV